MTRVDFYVLPETEDIGPVLTACRLCERAAGERLRIYAYVPDSGLADDIDSALWTFKQGSFVSHERVEAKGEDMALASVLIGAGDPPSSHHDVLLNLGDEVPAFFSRFQRVLEIVHGDAETRARSRARFKFYRDRGYDLASHKLGARA